MASILSAISSLLVGLFLVIAPWWAGLWDANYLLEFHPAISALVLSTFTRGAVTGLGLINVLLGIQEMRHRFWEGRHGT